MHNMDTIDARGLSCPEPVIILQQALKKLKNGAVEVLVDSGTARDNITRMAKHSGWIVQIEEQSSKTIKLTLSK